MYVIYHDSPYVGHKRVYVAGSGDRRKGNTPHLQEARAYKSRTIAQRVATRLNNCTPPTPRSFPDTYRWKVRKLPSRPLGRVSGLWAL